MTPAPRTGLATIAALVGLVAASEAWAQILEIPLPTLAGSYPARRERTTTVVLPEIPRSFTSVAIRVRGTTEIGVLLCPDAVEWPTRCVASFGPATGPRMLAVHYNQSPGAFEWTATFESVPSGEDWDILADGEELLHFEAGPSAYILPCAPASARPAVTVTEAVLVVAGNFEIPEPNSTWGRLKAGYR